VRATSQAVRGIDPRIAARTLLERVVGQGHPELAGEVVAEEVALLRPGFRSTARALTPDGSAMAPTKGAAIEGIRKGATAMRVPFPDYSQTVTRQLVDGDTVVNFVEIAGTQRGVFFGVPPTERPFRMEALIVTRVVDGKVVEVYALGDELGALLDLGFTLAPPKPKPAGSDDVRRS